MNKQNFSSSEQVECFYQEFGIFLDEFKKDNQIYFVYYFIFIFRRVFIAIMIVFSKSLIAQLSVSIFFNLIVIFNQIIMYLGYKRPYKAFKELCFEIVNEIFLFSYYFIFLSFESNLLNISKSDLSVYAAEIILLVIMFNVLYRSIILTVDIFIKVRNKLRSAKVHQESKAKSKNSFELKNTDII